MLQPLETNHHRDWELTEIKQPIPVTWESLLIEAAGILSDSNHTGCEYYSIPEIANALGHCLGNFIEDALTDPQYFLRHHGSEFYRALRKTEPDEE
jgi:hypothetical protein